MWYSPLRNPILFSKVTFHLKRGSALSPSWSKRTILILTISQGSENIWKTFQPAYVRLNPGDVPLTFAKNCKICRKSRTLLFFPKDSPKITTLFSKSFLLEYRLLFFPSSIYNNEQRKTHFKSLLTLATSSASPAEQVLLHKSFFTRDSSLF